MTFKLKLNNRIPLKHSKLKGIRYSLPKNLEHTPPKFIRICENINKRAYAIYLCQCGNQFKSRTDAAISGATKSCGCYKKRMLNCRKGIKHTHGHTVDNNISKTYGVWASMLQRCNDPNSKWYHRYGGRGIKVCNSWLMFENFLKDMGEVPKRLTIDRINNDKGYYKDNCRWATYIEQGCNKGNTVKVEWNGELIALKQLLRDINSPINYYTALHRYNHGWSLDKILSTPPRSKYKKRS